MYLLDIYDENGNKKFFYKLTAEKNLEWNVVLITSIKSTEILGLDYIYRVK